MMEAHTAERRNYRDHDGSVVRKLCLLHVPIKPVDKPWTPECVEHLSWMVGQGGNLDGHSLERYRKLLDAQRATDKLLMYFTDGEMHGSGEEADILVRNIALCRQRRYNLLGIAYKNDSPKNLGLDCITYYSGQDVARIVAGLDRYLSRH